MPRRYRDNQGDECEEQFDLENAIRELIYNTGKLLEGQDALMRGLQIINWKGNMMARSLDEAIAAMERNTTVEEGLYTLLETLKTQAANIGLKPEDQAKVDAIFDKAEAQSARAAAALMVNVPLPSGGGARANE